MNIGERIREVREAEGLGRQIFSDMTGIKKQTLIKIETNQTPKFAAIELEKVAMTFPDYALYLVTGSANDEVAEKLSSSLYYRKLEKGLLKPLNPVIDLICFFEPLDLPLSCHNDETTLSVAA